MMTLLVVLLLVAFISGAELFAVMIAAAALGAMSSARDFIVEFDGLIVSVFGGLTDDKAATLSTIPMFIYAGYLLAEAKTADRLVRFANAVLGWLPGGLAIVTIMIAYTPMLFVPGVAGKFFRQIPVVVIGVLFISLMESLFILPAHLAHSKENKNKVLRWIDRQQGKIGRGLEWAIARFYVPLVSAATHRRYLTLAIAFACCMCRRHPTS